ncbi:MAG: nickel-responsive transcriptional regulator NikR [Candidatus Omnitrophica bacterium]|jgi:CopG family nickel-responsive transcriptional regulator|nr:nickel-responsive transcriptional regulator NikR [Candidatus Omnitrophota bacterium]MDD3274980.1 nickel-responsive transcriptional regulator NikR [Candidatus Omnitrophota bacterium]MDD5077786.1 nickel-responsive transcriptional regulator NikR [Candidatus Omnitrophota bacterium]MDD5725722.1 nickel-responsive transcriptional regulator NikR [Candidatus Omnitrophota bacterium]
MALVRFGVSIEKGLLSKFDRFIKERKYTNRSEAFRDLVRRELVSEQWQGNAEVSGAITLVYDHHKRELVNKLMDIQHDFGKLIISSQHIHLDHDNCLEIIAVKGESRQAQKLADSLNSVKGVKHATLSMSATGKGI